jgi:hypothetical protein
MIIYRLPDYDGAEKSAAEAQNLSLSGGMGRLLSNKIEECIRALNNKVENLRKKCYTKSIYLIRNFSDSNAIDNRGVI